MDEYVVLKRNIINSNIINSPAFKVYIWCLCKSNSNDGVLWGEAKLISIKKGQFDLDIKEAEKCLSMEQELVNDALILLTDNGDILIHNIYKHIIVEIVGYEDVKSLAITNNKAKKTKEQQSMEEKYRIFINEFNNITLKVTGKKRSFRGDNKSKRQFFARLKEGYRSSDFMRAITNMYRSKNHIESEYMYATPELITRSEKLAMYSNM